MIDERSLFQAMKEFLEEREVSGIAAAPLKDGVQIGLRFAGCEGDYHAVKEGGRMRLKEGPASQPDWTATVTPTAVRNLLAFENADIGDLGVEVFKRMARGILDPESDDHIKVHLEAGFFTIMRHGYLGILPLGGPKVAKWLAQHGLKNISGIRRVFKKLRGSE